MKRYLLSLFVLLTLFGGLTVTFIKAVHAKTGAVPISSSCITKGTLPGGATYIISLPSIWNGTLLLYSHGYVSQGSLNPAQDVGDPLTGAALLQQGYALAGSSYSQTGWALQQAFHDQIPLLDYFAANFGQPTRPLAWGHSLGGITPPPLHPLLPQPFPPPL